MIEFNPFDDLIVKEPRRPEPAVSGLNEQPLRAVLAHFERLAAGAPPRRVQRAGQALLVTSDQPGFGKSHLIGRLFRALHGRATLIYVRPFQNAALAFQSLLAAVVKELHFPDRADWESWKPEEPTQLDALAHGVLGHLVADLAEKQGDGDPEQVARIRRDPLEAFAQGNRGDAWSDWMRATFEDHRVAYDAAMSRRGLSLHSPEWLRVLFAYGYGYPDRVVRQACLDWIAGQSLSAEQAGAIGLRAADVPHAEMSAEDANQTSRERLIDLSQLAAFYRPFVFCFDQTEAYGHAPGLARTFGMVVARLIDEAANHLTLITSNQDPWTTTIKPHFERADAERIAHPPVSLEGLRREQGEELIRLRLAASEAPAEAATEMLGGDWLSARFTTDRDRVGTRQFLQSCKERWEELRHRPVTRTSLPELYEARRVNLLAEPKRLLFDADLLQWLVKTCADGLPDLQIASKGSGYFTTEWTVSERRILFGFEPGSNWRRWSAIARHAQERAAKQPGLKAVCFRGTEQSAIPGPAWMIGPAIEEAKRRCLQLIVVTRDDFAVLHAGYDLYAEALGGDIPPFTSTDVVAFLRERFAHWWERILAPIESAAEPVPPPDDGSRMKALAGEVRGIVAAQKFLSVEEVIGNLAAAASREEVLQACGYSAEIRVHAHPQMTVLQWQSI
ncbi:MAG TPA: hypothetical protein VGO90_02950 [Chthoniobacteraceae bacterium]|nr:hypothetical protein [Chthoniobacteraceae bacterium]